MRLSLLLVALWSHVDSFEQRVRIHHGDVLKLKCESLLTRSIYSEGTCYYTYFFERDARNKCKESFREAELVTEHNPVLDQLDGKFNDFHGSDTRAQMKRALCSYDASSKCEEDEQMIGNSLCQHVEEERNYIDASFALAYCRERKSTLPAIDNAEMNQAIAGFLSREQASGGWLLQQTVKRGAGMGWQFPHTPRAMEYFDQLESENTTPICKNEEAMVIRTLTAKCSNFGAWRFEDQSKLNTAVCVRPADTDFEPVAQGTEGPLPNTGSAGKPTTTAPKATTTKVSIVARPGNDVLTPLKYLYNAFHIRHAFCATVECIKYVNKKDVGFSPTWSKAGWLGRIVAHTPKGVAWKDKHCKDLTNLSFKLSGGRYVADFREGLRAGYVSKTKGYCGATVPIKEWGCRMSKDLMYGQNLEWNTFYKGLVRRRGQPVFYIWK